MNSGIGFRSLLLEVTRLLTEQEVARSWARIISEEISDETIAKAEALLAELRPESPLRHRIDAELDEIRERAV